MQDELTIEMPGMAGGDDQAATTTARASRRTPRQAWKALGYNKQERVINVAFAVAAVVVVGGILFMAFGYPAIRKHNDRVQAVQRAMKMDGEVFTITSVSWNWIGDTRLHLQNARGEDAGWIMIHSENPIHKDINPFYLAFTPKRYDPLPLPMTVRAHFRPQPWVETVLGRERTHENFTGSFLEFEQVETGGGR